MGPRALHALHTLLLRHWGRASGLGDLPPEAEGKCDISVQFERFPVQNSRFNEYKSERGHSFCANKHNLKNVKIQCGDGVWTHP